ncbi:hypothetical protein [Flavobacterium sp. SORGH_AS_0622]|jgi:hypothetical protein|uniref:hypothetical protein n=1 Tax=Flavobacterium sp. SORGH_AS_0622 TaxID=3041772 RepID=UPI0027855A2F|nr:hypothetical protein [Flavobacterium sp. SORGH_AS_0622]MDQ1166711.1 hypothetical protein [Flavobacterium sp. SORGH_AS_0622]
MKKAIDKSLNISSYGICLFSIDILEDFLKNEKIKSKKLLKNFQDNHDRYLALLKKGIWLPFTPINSIEYIIKIENLGESFDNQWLQKLKYDDFNIEIKDSLWITDTGSFYQFDKNKFSGEEISYQTLDGETLYSGLKFNLSSGKYLVSITGFTRNKELKYPHPNYGFLFSLKKVEEFDSVNDPREDEKYNFNIADI